jgi:Flp pilus assembly pilin Flp
VERVGRLLRREDGQAVIEYGVLGALISVVAIALISGIGTKIAAMFEAVVNTLS